MGNKRNNQSKNLIILALIIGVVGLSIGLATFSGRLNIEEEVNVTPDSKYFKVNFSSSSTELLTDSIEPQKSSTQVTATPGNISNSNEPVITGISVTFTEPGQNVIYNFHTFNTGKYEAFLKEVNFNNISGATVFKRCTALPGSTARNDLVQAACEDIKVSIKVKDTLFSATNTNITSHSLARNSSEPVQLKIEYVDNDHWSDGDFKVELGTISLKYASVD